MTTAEAAAALGIHRIRVLHHIANAGIQSIRYRLVKLGVAIPLVRLDAIYDVHFNLMPMIYKAIQSGKLWERIDV